MASLPGPGEHEGPSLDFKRYDASAEQKRFELAKDVAALANTRGGTIVVGALCAGDRLLKYEPIPDPSRTKALARAFEEAVRDRCYPAPLIEVQVFNREGAGEVLAVHVAPSMAPVAVWLKAAVDEGYGERAWVFFIRVGSHSRSVSPEQVTLMFNDNVRRIVILLNSIGPEDDIELGHLVNGNPQGSPGWYLVKVDELTNTFHVRRRDNSTEATEPIDGVRAIYKRPNGRWFVLVQSYRELI
jgi:hypothetical protein